MRRFNWALSALLAALFALNGVRSASAALRQTPTEFFPLLLAAVWFTGAVTWTVRAIREYKNRT